MRDSYESEIYSGNRYTEVATSPLDTEPFFRYNDMNAYIQSRSQAQREERCTCRVRRDVRALFFLLCDGIRSLPCDEPLILRELAKRKRIHTLTSRKRTLSPAWVLTYG